MSASDESLDFALFIIPALCRCCIARRYYPIQVSSFFFVTYHYNATIRHLTERDEAMFIETVVDIIDGHFEWIVKYG